MQRQMLQQLIPGGGLAAVVGLEATACKLSQLAIVTLSGLAGFSAAVFLSAGATATAYWQVSRYNPVNS